VINLDKTIKQLTTRLDVVHPYSASSYISNQSNRNDGINYWKGKTIISTKAWNDLYQKSSTYTDTYKNILTSRKPLQYFPDDYNSSIYSLKLIDELKEEAQEWNKEYYELLEYRKNPTLGRMRCSKCLLSGSNDDSIFVGIEKVFARIVRDQCNKNNAVNSHSDGIITYHCNIMNIFSCPFENKEDDTNSGDERGEESKYPYKREDLYALHQISFAIEQAITTFFEITKNNEIIYEVDFVNDRVQEIHTNYNGEAESWGWNDNVNEQLSKVKPIAKIVIRDEQDIYNILTNREKLETLIEEYEKKNSHRLANEEQLCYDEKSRSVPNDNNNSNKIMKIDAPNCNNANVSHKGENRHSKKIIEELDREQQILLKDNKEAIIDFLSANKDSIRIEDLKNYEPIYKCYRKKGNCHVCNSLTNIICVSCNHNYKEVWVCNNHWKQHVREKHQ
jgi:hypothetical protein